MDLNSEKGSSSWLMVSPFSIWPNMNSGMLYIFDMVAWTLPNIWAFPDHCVCGESFSPDHVMICHHGGLTFVCHNEIRDMTHTAEWLELLYHDVVIEPPLQPLTWENVIPATANRQDDARADIHAWGFWGHWQSAFFDASVFTQIMHKATATPVSLLYIYRCYEMMKQEYGDRVWAVEHRQQK